MNSKKVPNLLEPPGQPDFVSEIPNRLGDEPPSIRVVHGEAEVLANQIQSWRRNQAGGRQPLSTEATAACSKGVLLPGLIRVLEDLRDD